MKRPRRARKNVGWISWVVFLVVAAVMAVVLLVGWQYYQGRPLAQIIPQISSGDSKATLNVGLRVAPKSLDIRHDDSDELQQALLGNVYETLLQRDNNNTLQPGLASSWNVSNNGLQYNFTLRRNVRFSNGEPVEASTVLQSLKEGITNRYPGYAAFSNLMSVSTNGKYEFSLQLQHPDALLLRRLAGRAGIVYYPHAANGAQANMATGPFVIDRYDQGKQLILKRNPSYWDKSAACAGITMQYFASDDAMATAFEQGAIQVAVPLEGTQNKRLASIADTQLLEGKSTKTKFIAFNTTVGSIFVDRRVRQAARHAINGATAASQDPQAGPLQGGPISELSPGYEDLNGLYPYDPGKARSMFSYYGSSYLGHITFIAERSEGALARQLANQLTAASGFSITVEELDADALHQRIAQHKFDIALTSTSQTLQEGDFGQSGSPLVLQEAPVEEDFAKALQSRNAQEYVQRIRQYARDASQAAAAHWLYTRKSVVAVKNQVNNMPVNMTDQLLVLRDVTVR